MASLTSSSLPRRFMRLQKSGAHKTTTAVSRQSLQRLPIRLESHTRRLHNKEIWTNDSGFLDLEAEEVEFSQRMVERASDNYSLIEHNVVPLKGSFRNLHLRGLLQYATGTLDENKALISKGEPAPQGYQSFASLNSNQFEKVHRAVTEHLTQERVFYLDRPIGSLPEFEVRARIIFDNPNLGLYFENLLSRTPNVLPIAHKPQLVVYIPSSLNIKPEEYGLTSSSFSAFHGQDLVFGGVTSPQILTNDIFLAASKILLEKSDYSVIPLSGSSVVSDDKLALVIGDDTQFLSKTRQLFGAHHHFWTPKGVTRAWDGVTYPFYKGLTLSRGNFVESLGKQRQRSTLRLNSPNIGPHPSHIFFLSNFGNITKLTTSEAVQVFTSGFDGKSFLPFFGASPVSVNVEKLVSGFQNLLSTSKARVFAINPAAIEDVVETTLSSGKDPKGEKLGSDAQQKLSEFISKTFPSLSKK